MKNNWKEISENETKGKIIEELTREAEKFLYNVRHKKLSIKEKMKYGVSAKVIRKTINQVGEEFLTNQIITKGLQKMNKTLEKGQEVEFDKFYLKKENNKFFIKNRL